MPFASRVMNRRSGQCWPAEQCPAVEKASHRGLNKRARSPAEAGLRTSRVRRVYPAAAAGTRTRVFLVQVVNDDEARQP